MDGTVAMTGGGTTVTEQILISKLVHGIKVGDTITIAGAGNTTSGVIQDTGNYDTSALVAKVTAITSDTSLTVDTVTARSVSK